VTCGVCKERLYVDLSVDNELLKSKGRCEQETGETGGSRSGSASEDKSEEDDFAMSSEVYDNIVNDTRA